MIVGIDKGADDRTHVAILQGAQWVCELPDAGPWRLRPWGKSGSLLCVSEQSGLWLLQHGELTKLLGGQAP